MVPLAKFDISLKNTPPGLAPFCTESWQKGFLRFFSQRKTKGIYGKTRKSLRRREIRALHNKHS